MTTDQDYGLWNSYYMGYKRDFLTFHPTYWLVRILLAFVEHFNLLVSLTLQLCELRPPYLHNKGMTYL